MSDINKHPGYLGLTSQGVILIHANWPVYPEEHGPDIALIWLTVFPPKTVFKMISDIDRCNLFLAYTKRVKENEPFNKNNYHVAIWHEDLLNLQKHGFIDGVKAITERKWQELKRLAYANSKIYINENGKMKEITLPSLDEYDDEIYSWPEFHLGHIEVTFLGREYAQTALANSKFSILSLGKRVENLLTLHYYDAAIREACVSLEYKIKKWLNCELYGQPLVNLLVSRLEHNEMIIQSYSKVFCAQIKMMLNYIRNEYMHNLVDIDEIQCKAILVRLAIVNEQVDDIISNFEIK
jgi:hypothetical protein